MVLSTFSTFVVVGFQDLANVGHAAVSQLDCVPVEYFLEVVVAWEVSVQYIIEELAANVGGDVGAEGWVEPGDAPLPSPSGIL